MSDYSNQPGRKNDPLYWIIAFGLMFTGVAAPVGVLMIVMRLLDGNKKRGRHPYYAQQEGQDPVGARTTQEAAPRAASSPQPRKRKKPRSWCPSWTRRGKRWL